MKVGKGARAGIGVALIALGFALAWVSHFRETRVVIGAEGCHLVTDVIDRGDDVRGYVVLLHGLSANKKIMTYVARAFAEENLRVFVPDLPGHGRTPGPFSFSRAESCAENFVKELSARRAIDPQRTILAGHSMGGAIAIRVGARVPTAGVIAISPAPMRAAHGMPAEMLPYTNPPPLPSNTLVMAAAMEPLGIRELSQDLVAEGRSGSSKFVFLPRATHVSVMFDSRVARAAQEWAAKALGLATGASLPSAAPAIGSVLGLMGILLLAGPFLRETMGQPGGGVEQNEATTVTYERAAAKVLRAVAEVALVSLFAIVVLRFWTPLGFLKLYNGAYFASFLLIAGLVVLAVHHKEALASLRAPMYALLLALFAGLVLHLLVTAWFDATLTEAWLTWARWARVPVFFVAALAAMLAEEVLLGTRSMERRFARLWLAMTMRLVAFLALVFGIFVLHSGAILIILLALFLAVFFVFQRMGMDVVRLATRSALAAAVFGAILLAGFCLVIFPIT